MLGGDYADPTMRVLTFQKDLDIISGFLREVDCPALLFTAAAQLNLAALAQGHANEDTASVFAVLQLLAGAAEPSSAGAPRPGTLL